MKTGKLPPRYDKRTLHYATYRDPATKVTVPSTFGHFTNLDYGMLGNDLVGDCVPAGADHETIGWLAEHRHPTHKLFTKQTALEDYSAVTGYTPLDPSTDQGTVVIDFLNYRRNTGVLDASGGRHKIAAYVAIEPGNWQHVAEAAYLFGAVGIGIEFPNSAQDQFSQGRPWSVVPGAKIEGGHYVPVVGARPYRLKVVTWGAVQEMTHHFLDRYCDEAYAILSMEHLEGGKTLEGFDLAHLQADLAALAQ